MAATHTRLLLAERDELLPLLRDLRHSAPLEFDRPTVCAGWTVRDVVAHCAAALTRVASGRVHDFSAEANEVDVDVRRHRTLAEILTELEQGYEAAAAKPQAVTVALGEWVHGGDIREALRLPGAYAHAGVADAMTLLAERSVAMGLPPVDVTLVDAVERGLDGAHVCLGDPDAEPVGWLRTDVAGLVRLVAGRRPELVEWDAVGIDVAQLRLFR